MKHNKVPEDAREAQMCFVNSIIALIFYDLIKRKDDFKSLKKTKKT